MQELMRDFPRPVLVVDGSLAIKAYSRRTLSIFGIRWRSEEADLLPQLQAAITDDEELDTQLALATACLIQPGNEEGFVWRHRESSFEVVVSAAEGDGDRFWVMFNDTTQRVMSEEILLNNRYYLEHILDNIPVGIIVLNEELKITSVNGCEVDFLRHLGIELDLVHAVGSSLAETLPDDPGQRWQQMCEQAVREGEGLKEVKQVYSTGSSELVLSTEVSPLRNRDGHITGAILVFDDVTEQSRLEQELIRVEKLAVVGQMVITVNHEINNPLNIISNNAQALRLLNPDFNDKTVTKLRSIEEQVKRIAQVTERLRTMEQVTTDSYIADGPQMVDVWGSERRGGS